MEVGTQPAKKGFLPLLIGVLLTVGVLLCAQRLYPICKDHVAYWSSCREASAAGKDRSTTASAFERYLRENPNGRHAVSAKQKVTYALNSLALDIERQGKWKEAGQAWARLARLGTIPEAGTNARACEGMCEGKPVEVMLDKECCVGSDPGCRRLVISGMVRNNLRLPVKNVEIVILFARAQVGEFPWPMALETKLGMSSYMRPAVYLKPVSGDTLSPRTERHFSYGLSVPLCPQPSKFVYHGGADFRCGWCAEDWKVCRFDEVK
jgi:hypothetical protein